jgi:hypothetical protein
MVEGIKPNPQGGGAFSLSSFLSVVKLIGGGSTFGVFFPGKHQKDKD